MSLSNNSRVTILSPTYLSGGSHYQTGAHTHDKKKIWYKPVFESYYKSMVKPYPAHHFKDDSEPKSKSELCDFLKSIGANYSLLDGERTNGHHALIKLIESVKTDYLFFILDDTMLVKQKDFITPCIEALDTDKSLLQIKLGAGIIGNGPDNKSNVTLLGENKAIVKVAPKTIYTGRKVSTGDTIWTMELKSKNIQNEFPLSYYNCFMRTEYVHRIHEVVRNKGFGKGVDFSSYLAFMNYTNDTNNMIREKGWPSGFEFIEQYKSGWLNFCSYVYHIGGAGRSIEKGRSHAKTHCNEIHI